MSKAREQMSAIEYPAAGGRLKDMPETQRPRELFKRLGPGGTPDADLLAILLRTGTRGRNVRRIAEQLLEKHRSLTRLSQATVEELMSEPGIGPVKAVTLKAALVLAQRLALEALPDRPAIRTPQDVVGRLRETVRGLERESFWVLLLDTKNRLLEMEEASRGILNASLVHPRDVFKQAVRASCASVVLAHNHPSGDPTPSAEDIQITRQIVEAGRLIEIAVLDHIILGRMQAGGANEYFSFRESGLVQFST
jgi:DNA repair protein RadC